MENCTREASRRRKEEVLGKGLAPSYSRITPRQEPDTDYRCVQLFTMYTICYVVNELGRVAGTTRGDKGSPTNLKRNLPLFYDNK